MRQRLMIVLDLTIAAGFAALGGWEALAQPDHPGPPRYTATLAIAIGLGLAWRRRFPRLVLVGVAVLGVAPHVIAGAEPAFYGFLLPYLAAAYTAADRLTRRQSVVVPATGAGVLIALAARGHEFRTANQTAIVVLGVGAVYAVGRITRLARVRGETAVAVADLLRREQDLRAREAIAAERERLAGELHDAIAHEVAVMVIHAGAAERMLGTDPDQARESMQAVQQAGHRTIEELYLMLGLLRAEEMSDVPPGLGRLPELVDRVRASGLSVDLSISGEDPGLSTLVSLCAYRIAQESLTNVLKHASGSRAAVHVRYEGDSIRIEISDDGGGRQAAGVAAGLGSGLPGLHERVRALGGRFSAGPDSEGGFLVGATLPFMVPSS